MLLVAINRAAKNGNTDTFVIWRQRWQDPDAQQTDDIANNHALLKTVMTRTFQQDANDQIGNWLPAWIRATKYLLGYFGPWYC